MSNRYETIIHSKYRWGFLLALAIASVTIVLASPTYSEAQEVQATEQTFRQLENAGWEQAFFDDGKGCWQDHWFLDGENATVTNSQNGMIFLAGPHAGEDADHAVLWTKQSFSGNLRMEFDYTRLDHATRYANLIYIQATGQGAVPYSRDITQWSELRCIPKMSLYYNHMNLLHLSIASFDNKNDDPGADYIRLRQYMPDAGRGLEGTEISPGIENAGLFQPGKTYHLILIKYGKDFYVHIKGNQQEKLLHWSTASKPPITEGWVGIRHMGSRQACYKNIRISISKTNDINTQ